MKKWNLAAKSINGHKNVIILLIRQGCSLFFLVATMSAISHPPNCLSWALSSSPNLPSAIHSSYPKGSLAPSAGRVRKYKEVLKRETSSGVTLLTFRVPEVASPGPGSWAELHGPGHMSGKKEQPMFPVPSGASQSKEAMRRLVEERQPIASPVGTARPEELCFLRGVKV